MLPHSIRGNLLLWLSFLLVCILAGFGVTAYELQQVNQMNKIDRELEQRVAALTSDALPLRPSHNRTPDSHEPRAPDSRWSDSRGKNFRDRDRDSHGLTRAHHVNEFDTAVNDSRIENTQSCETDEKIRPAGNSTNAPGREFSLRQITLTAETKTLLNDAGGAGWYYAFWSRDGRLMAGSSNPPVQLKMPVRQGEKTVIQWRNRDRGETREAWHFTEMGECALVGRSIGADMLALRWMGWRLVGAGFAVLAVGLGVGYWLVGRAVYPLEEICVAAGRVSAGDLSERVPVPENASELGRLAGVLNTTFSRLETAFAEQKRFTADASHELRTPLAVIISEAQTTLARERTPAEYRETVEACLETAQQMRRLTESLLQLARFDAGQECVKKAPCDLAAVALAATSLLRPLADLRGIRIHTELAPAPFNGDYDRIQQVITNLVANAIHYNRDNGSIYVTVTTAPGDVLCTVRDTGPGIAREELSRVFERFYRADAARSRSEGNTGLGLAICQAIVQAHGGSISVDSTLGEGTTFTVRLPSS